MAWDIKITPIPDMKGLDNPKLPANPDFPHMGDITATWTDGDGTFIFSGISPIDEIGQAEFIELAAKGHEVWKKKKIENNTVTGELEERINNADPLK